MRLRTPCHLLVLTLKDWCRHVQPDQQPAALLHRPIEWLLPQRRGRLLLIAAAGAKPAARHVQHLNRLHQDAMCRAFAALLRVKHQDKATIWLLA